MDLAAEPCSVTACIRSWLAHPIASTVKIVVTVFATLFIGNAVIGYARQIAPDDPRLIPIDDMLSPGKNPRVVSVGNGNLELILHYALAYNGKCTREGSYSLRPQLPLNAEPHYWPAPGFQNGVDSPDPGARYWVHIPLPPGITPGTWFFSLRIHYTCPWNLWVHPLSHPLLLIGFDSNVPVVEFQVP